LGMKGLRQGCYFYPLLSFRLSDTLKIYITIRRSFGFSVQFQREGSDFCSLSQHEKLADSWGTGRGPPKQNPADSLACSGLRGLLRAATAQVQRRKQTLVGKIVV